MRRRRKESQARNAGDGSGAAPITDGPRTHSRRYLMGSFALIVISKLQVGEAQVGRIASSVGNSCHDGARCLTSAPDTPVQTFAMSTNASSCSGPVTGPLRSTLWRRTLRRAAFDLTMRPMDPEQHSYISLSLSAGL